MKALHYQTIADLSRALEGGELSASDLLEAVISRTEAVESRVAAFTHRDVEDARTQARASDERRANGQARGPLDGIPIGIKDLLAVKDQPLTCGSKMLEHFVSPYDATCIQKLKAAGAVLWGRLNMDEFAMGSSTEHSAFQETRNPWALDHIPGGSSGGSAAAVAAGEVIASLGSDTGGSVRQPASFCGIVGLKPTYGLISRYGLVAYASSLDQVGPCAHTVEDVAILLQSIVGQDPLDSTSLPAPEVDYREALKQSPERPRRLGVPSEFFGKGLDPEVKAAVEAAINFYKAAGCDIVEINLPHADLAIPVYYLIATAEASSNLARYDGVRYSHRSKAVSNAIDLFSKSRSEGFGEEVKRRIILGTYVLSSGYYDAYYLKAQKIRTLIRRDFETAFQEVDAILAPTAPTPAFKRGAHSEDPLAMYLSDIYTISVNLAGLPAISIPCGFSGSGLPIGLQIIGQAMGEGDLLSIAHQYEQAHDFTHQNPKL